MSPHFSQPNDARLTLGLSHRPTTSTLPLNYPHITELVLGGRWKALRPRDFNTRHYLLRQGLQCRDRQVMKPLLSER